jgi:eukaryotic-like serine/threonine-protein kinase
MSPESDRSPATPDQADDTTLTTQYDSNPDLPKFGPYLVLRKLGEGGMGVVYHAKQLDPIRREVALKLIKPGMDSQLVIARFEGERQALALMDHPNIARVLDAGTTSTGLPYFVMELVFGAPITRYCDSKRLNLRGRIELFVPVCRAIQHAHQKGIIHRDIKPSNVLISERDGNVVPKIIDFGLAKALGGELTDATLMTIPGVVVGTVRYMSPEQAEPGKNDVDTRSDVYSLGVLLYELVTGTTPLGDEKVGRSGYLELLQRIRVEDPAPPSLRVRRSGTAAEISALRNSNAARYPGLLHGELDWIVMKALEKDRSRRYESANGLARDLERFLAGEPLEAAPASTSYRIRKLARRHRAWLVTASAFIMFLIAGIIVSSSMAVRAARAEREALRERNIAKSVSDFLQNDVLAQASANTQAGAALRPDPDLKVRTALDRAADRIGGKFAEQPLVEASIRHTIASSYQDLGLYSMAQPHAERSLELRRRELGERHIDTARGFQLVGRLKWLQGRYTEAEGYFAKGIEIDRRVLGEEHPETLKGIDDLASSVAYQGKWEQAHDLFAKALNIKRRLLGEENAQTLATMNNLAATCFRQGNYSEAGALHEQALQIRRSVLGNEHPSTLVSLNNLGEVYLATGDYARADTLLSQALMIRERVLGPEHPNTLTTLRDLGVLRLARAEHAEAERLFVKALETRRRVLGEQHPDTLASVRDLAKLRQAQGRLGEAEALLTKAEETMLRAPVERRPDLPNVQMSLGQVRLQLGKYAEAEKVLREALLALQGVSPGIWLRYRVEHLLGTSLVRLNRFAAAEPLLLSGYQGLMQLASTAPAADRVRPEQAAEPIVMLYRKWGRPQDAAKWQDAGHSTPAMSSGRR